MQSYGLFFVAAPTVITLYCFNTHLEIEAPYERNAASHCSSGISLLRSGPRYCARLPANQTEQSTLITRPPVKGGMHPPINSKLAAFYETQPSAFFVATGFSPAYPACYGFHSAPI